MSAFILHASFHTDMALQMLLNGTNDPTRPFTITIPPNITVTPYIHRSGQGRAVPSNCDMPTKSPATTDPSTDRSSTAPPTKAPGTTDRSSTAPPVTCPPPVNIQDQLQLKDREIYGIGIGLFFGGLIIGSLLTLLVLCICRCACGGRGSYGVNKNVQYKKHNDDITFPT